MHVFHVDDKNRHWMRALIFVFAMGLSIHHGPSLISRELSNQPETKLQQESVGKSDPESPRPQGGEWQDLFDGQTLGGWVQRGGKAKFLVADEEIVGVTVRGEPNSYLCTEKSFRDFELELEFRVEDDRLNSGIQVRSQSLPEFQKGVVHGHQVEIDPSDRGWTGAIYDEARDGWLAKPKSGEDSSRVFRVSQWNTLRIVCRGTRVSTWLNDIQTIDFTNARLEEGFIALQLHSTLEVQEMKIRFRKIRLLELDAGSSTP